MSNHTSDLNQLIEAFQRLSAIDDPVKFCVELEREQKQSGLRLGTFREAWKAWKAEASKNKIETKGEDA